MLTLGIETSCDETAAAVVRHDGYVLSNVIASQIELFEDLGGVVPEMAARAHTEKMLPVVREALQRAEVGWDDIDRIAVTEGPGLIGSLLIGQSTARALAFARHKPLDLVDHLRAHVLAVSLQARNPKHEILNKEIEFPAVGLLVSGGHTELIFLKDREEWEIIGQTRDDAAGEAFDKVGKLLGLPYPGGPNIAKQAKLGDPTAFDFPRSYLEKDSLDFSFSGLKTAVLREVKKRQDTQIHRDTEKFVADVAASFQQAVVDVLADKLELAVAQLEKKGKIGSVLLAGGVAANQALRSELAKRFGSRLHVPELEFCTDNAAMVGVA